MKEVFGFIDNWLVAQGLDVNRVFNPPASAAEIAKMEAAYGIVFPDDVQQCYLWHNGQPEDAPVIFSDGSWLSLNDMASYWHHRDGIDFDYDNSPPPDNKKIAFGFWHPKWLPIIGIDMDHHDCYCLDFVPGEGGVVGQLVESEIERMGDNEVVADSFSGYLNMLHKRLKSEGSAYYKKYNRVLTIAEKNRRTEKEEDIAAFNLKRAEENLIENIEKTLIRKFTGDEENFANYSIAKTLFRQYGVPNHDKPRIDAMNLADSYFKRVNLKKLSSKELRVKMEFDAIFKKLTSG